MAKAALGDQLELCLLQGLGAREFGLAELRVELDDELGRCLIAHRPKGREGAARAGA